MNLFEYCAGSLRQVLKFVLVSTLAVTSSSAQDPFNCAQIPTSAFQTQSITSPSGNGIALDFISYGATAQRLLVPTPAGRVDILLGFDDGSVYCTGQPSAGHPYFGATIGRVANRIRDGQFPWKGGLAHTSINEEPGNDTLHGGQIGFDRNIWGVTYLNKSAVAFNILSPDGDMGFPGDVNATVTWVLDETSWTLSYSAYSPSGADTVVSLTNHAYFNLNGAVEQVLEHSFVMPAATRVLDVDNNLLPTGSTIDVTDHSIEANAALDFTSPKLIGADINNTRVYSWGTGFDNAFIFNDYVPGQGLVDRAIAFSNRSGIQMLISTDQPSLQVYSGNFLNGSIPGKSDQPLSPGYVHWSALAIEAQQFPDAVNHANFPSIILRGGSVYTQITRYTFTVK